MHVHTKEEDDKKERRWDLMGFRRIFQMGYRDRFKLEQRAALLGKEMIFWNLQLTKRYRERKIENDESKRDDTKSETKK
jgi:hypothetical protein